MAGYTRQSAASIINGENITAPPINAEFNQLKSAFDGTSGHAHDGTTGNGPQISLTTSVSGFLPAANGGLGGKNNYAATTNPTVGDDTNDGYAVGSAWYNVPNDRYYICVYNAVGAAVWLENRFIDSNGDLRPHSNGLNDLGHTLKRWKDLFLSGNADIDGSLNVATTTYLGGILTVNANANFATGTTTTISNIDVASGAIDNAAIGTSVAAAGTFTTLNANTSFVAATADINGGSVDGATIGASTPSTGAFTTLGASGTATLATVDINAGAIDGTTIGASNHTTGKFTTLQSTGQATLATVNIDGGTIDGATVGATTAASGAFTTVAASGAITGNLTGNVTGNTAGVHTGAVTGAVTGNVSGDVSSSGTSTFNNVTIDGTLNMNAGTSATITNLTAPTNDLDAATKKYVDDEVAGLVDSAPGALDTLNELAAALGDDADFSTTITNSIATKLPLAGGTVTGAIAMSTNKITGVGDPTAAQDVATKVYTDTQRDTRLATAGGTMSGEVAMGNNKITGLATPTANTDASSKGYVDGVLGSATSASTSADTAIEQAGIATTKAGEAAGSATAAAGSATTASTALATFQNQYLGAQGSAPTADPDGSALDIGDLYFDTTAGAMKVYSANGWTNAGSSVNGTTNRHSYTAISGQTVFAATYDAGYVDVFLNGVKQLVGTDVIATSGTSVVFASGTSVNDIVEIVGYGTFVLADHLTQAQSDARYVNLSGDTMTGNLSFGDDDKAIFGAGSDLQIYHDGNDSYISEGGTGDLKIQGANVRLENPSGVRYFQGSSGNSYLYNSGDIKLATTSTGIDVTGDITASGSVNVGNDLNITGPSPIIKLTDNDTADEYTLIQNLGGATFIDGRNGTGNGAIIFRGQGGGTNDEYGRFIANGNFGIGQNVPTAPLHVNSGGINNVARFHSNDSTASLYLTDGTTTGGEAAVHGLVTTGDDLEVRGLGKVILATGTADRLTIDSSGNVLVGKTSATITTTGVEMRPGGQLFATQSSNYPLLLNRTTSDGDIAVFRKDNEPMGSIGADDGNFVLDGTATTTKSGIGFGGSKIIPRKNQLNNDNGVDLGSDDYRFRDAYLSGGVKFGGATNSGGVVSSSNTLDDYEEGSWTPVYSDASSGGNTGVANGNKRGRYTKVGNLVTVTASCANLNTSGMTGTSDVYIQGAPFAAVALAGSPTTFWIGATRMGSVEYDGYVTAMISDGVSYIRFSETRNNASVDQLIISLLNSGAADLHFTLTYETSS